MATGDVLVQRGSVISLKQSGGTHTLSFAPSGTGVASGAGRLAGRLNLAAFPKADALLFRCVIKSASVPTTGRVLRVYLGAAEASTGAADTAGYHTESDQAISDEDRLRSLDVIGVVPADEGTIFVRYIVAPMPLTPYASVAIWNDYGVGLSNTASDCYIDIYPIYMLQEQ